jgi:serine protease
LIANDNGLGWHADPTDPGDWIDSTDITEPIFIDSGCTTVEQSSWHGTRVAGIIGAVTNNGIGIAGVAPNTMILPVRAVGKCSGFMSDIVSAMLWAAGLPVGSLGTNPNPAKVINVSLGSNVPCSATEQDAVTTITAAGVLVVASAGNDGGPVNAPASCSGVLSVGGLRHEGDKVAYSSLSSTAAAIGIAAPAGNCVNLLADEVCQYSIETTTNSGLTTPGTDAYTYAVFTSGYYTTSGSTVICNTALINCKNAASVGTSFSAPLAAGVAALMLAVNPNLAPTQLIARMQSSALPFPTSTSISTKACTIEPTTTDANGAYTDTSQNTNCLCTTATCGAGMLNAAQAVQTAIAPFVSITASATSASLGQRIRLDGSGSTAASGHTIASYQWTANPDASLENANQPVATLVFPAFRSITVTLTITDEDGASASASTTIKSAFAVATGSGGGALGLELLGLAALAAWRIRARGGRAAERGRTVLN